MSHYHQLGQAETTEEKQRIQFDEWVKSKERFVVRVGKFGCYIYDSKTNTDLELSIVLQFLNLIDNPDKMFGKIFTEKEILLIEGVRKLSDVDKNQCRKDIIKKLDLIQRRINQIMHSNILNDASIQNGLVKILNTVADL